MVGPSTIDVAASSSKNPILHTYPFDGRLSALRACGLEVRRRVQNELQPKEELPGSSLQQEGVRAEYRSDEKRFASVRDGADHSPVRLLEVSELMFVIFA